jgi:glycosyltransferase involved in cell wall biosynthesis
LPQYAEELYAECTRTNKETSSDFVFAGNVGDMQSVETIVKAANELRRSREILFHIVGDGSKLEYCQQLATDYKLENIKFYGRRPLSEMPHFYNMAKAMLITLKDNEGLSYTLPGKMQSYMAAGKPIIGAINGEARQVIEEAKCGLCCAAEDYRGLACLIEEFDGRADIRQMADNALGYYKNNYSKERFIAKLEAALMNLGG